MFRKRTFFVVSIIMILMMSISVFADSYTDTQRARGETYRKYMETSQAQFAAIGDISSAYTTLYNQDTSTFYMYVSVQEYVYDSGYGTLVKNSTNVAPGLVVATDRIARNSESYIRDYYHKGRIHVTSSETTPIMHTFSFVATQYYPD